MYVYDQNNDSELSKTRKKNQKFQNRQQWWEDETEVFISFVFSAHQYRSTVEYQFFRDIGGTEV